MQSGLAIDVQDVAGIADASRITLNGPLDARSIGAFKAAVQPLQERGIRRFILDLSDVKYVNSTGMSYLINLAESLGEGHTAVTLVGLKPKVKIIFDMMGVMTFFRMAPSVDSAVRALGTKPAPAPVRAASAPAPKSERRVPKTGRRPPPAAPGRPRSTNLLVRIFRKLFGRAP